MGEWETSLVSRHAKINCGDQKRFGQNRGGQVASENVCPHFAQNTLSVNDP